jgi:hypothetical protein
MPDPLLYKRLAAVRRRFDHCGVGDRILLNTSTAQFFQLRYYHC